MVRIFLNYRRKDDPGHAGRLFDRLRAALPEDHLFMDVDGCSILPGDDFAKVIEVQVAACDVLLAVVGPRWLQLLRERDSSRQDFVVLEIEAALKQRKRVIPVLVGDTDRPCADALPMSIRGMLRLQSVELRTIHFESDVTTFVEQLSRLRSSSTGQVSRPTQVTTGGKDSIGRWAAFEIGEVHQRMRFIPAGSFMMGAPDSDQEAASQERPQHRVRLTNGFWLAETECTQALWETVMGDNPSRFAGANRPVEQVSWDDVQTFMAKLNERLPGLNARLPTEAEWEWAARAGTAGSRYGELEDIAWYCDNSGLETHPVAQKQPNPWGLWDMLGNIWEWCADRLGEYPTGPIADPLNRVGYTCVLRGGSWINGAEHCRATHRSYAFHNDRDGFVGFRLAQGRSLGRDEVLAASGLLEPLPLIQTSLSEKKRTFAELQRGLVISGAITQSGRLGLLWGEVALPVLDIANERSI